MVGIRQGKEDWFRDSKVYPAECLIGRLDSEPGPLEVLTKAEVQAALGAGGGTWGSIGGTLSDQLDLQSELDAKLNISALPGQNISIFTNDAGYLTANQTITLSGDVSGSGTTSISTTLANSGVTADTYGGASKWMRITVDAKGRVTFAEEGILSEPVYTLDDIIVQGSSTSHQWQSTVSTGTSPFTVASATKIDNLNADMVDGKHVGTSGNVIPLLDGANTWSGAQTFSAGALMNGYATGSVLYINSTDNITEDTTKSFNYDGSGRLSVGDSLLNTITIAGSSFGANIGMAAHGTANIANLLGARFSNGATNSSNFIGAKARGASQAAATAVQDNHWVVTMRGLAFDGTDYEQMGITGFIIDEATPSGTAMGGEWFVQTTDRGTTTLTDRVRVYSNGDWNFSGNVGIGTATPGYKLDVAGDINTSTNFAVGGTAGLTSTYTFGGGASGDIATMTFTGGILTAVTTVP